ncbi:bifunctional proline dehydrogenase/L-glutamate gamma-semialdehyde dehydrogenase [Citricoccus sp. NPDC055426]|uniref:bifunctional proline dehydrogenase/L-glutamate gamma-semialdehyde dehydrogenase n=1 Tax=Citricoccus sp. NPDC055426 TaxID=3155536 RepID=UPI0034131707
MSTLHPAIPDPDELRTLAPAAVEQVKAWLHEARKHPSNFSAQQLAGVLKDPAGLDFTVGFVDRVIRPEDHRIAAEALADLAPQTPGFLPWYMRSAMGVGGRLAPLLAPVAVPAARRVLRELVSHLIVDATDAKLGPAIAKLQTEGIRLNINLLGEAILGQQEADRRMDGIRALIEREDVDYVSVKVSAATAPHSPWAFKEAVEEVTAGLLPLYELAASQAGAGGAAKGPTFINLDMEEYHDLDMTLAVFMRLMDTPALQDLEAGIVLQAYLPDALDAMIRLQEFAARRVAAGGAPLKVRVVKGANLPMEHVQASVSGWPAATVDSKQAADTNYKRVLNYALTEERTRNVRIGVAGHNLFDVALAWLLVRERGLSTRWRQGGPSPDVEFEMLLGMATGQAEAVRQDVGSLLLYTPVVHPHEFDVAISYLIRRLEEGASQENFMSAVFELDTDAELFAREEARFHASLEDLDTEIPTPARSQNRQLASSPGGLQASRGPVPDPVDGFANTPDTDPSLAANRDWGRAITAAVPGSTLGTETVAAAQARTPEQVQAAVGQAVSAGEAWRTLTGADRERVLNAVADSLEASRGALLEVAAAETGKTLDQGDPEVSEAIDFARYYGRLARGLDEVQGARFHPAKLVLVIPPWNFPVAIPTGGVLASLASGAPVVFKPAPQSVRTGAVAYEAIREGLKTGLGQLGWDADRVAGTAEHLVSFLSIDPDREAELGEGLITHPDVERVILTGGYETAQLFRSFRKDLPLLAETSGKNAIIVTPSADLDLAAKDVVNSAFGHAGQKCSASSLVILVGSVATSKRFHRQLLDAAASLTVGYPEDPRSQMGPVIEEPGEKLRRGLTELGAGEHWALRPQPLDDTDRLWSPGIRAGVRPGSDAHLTEYFGPVLGVMTAETLEDAVGLVNAVDYGLTSGLHSLDPDEIEVWLQTVQAGNLYVNRGITGAIVRRQPFGGWKRSTVGAGTKAGGPHYLHGLGTWTDAPSAAPSDAPAHDDGLAAAAEGSGSDSGRPATATDGLTGMGHHLADGADLDEGDRRWLADADRLDEAAWRETFGVARDVSGLMAERNVLRHLPVPVTIRWESGPLVHLLRVLMAGRRAGSALSVSVPQTLPADVGRLLAGDPDVVVHVEDTAAFHARAAQLTGLPPSAPGGGDPRIRLVQDWSASAADTSREALLALHEALDGSPDVAVSAGPVVSAGDVELLPFLHEQAISITAHRFGTPDHLTEHLL